MNLMFKKGQQLLELEAKASDLKEAKRHSITKLNAELQRLESDRYGIRGELSANLAKHKPQRDEHSKSSSFSSITSLKFLSRPISDSMSQINSKRENIEKYDKLINENIEKVLW